MKMNVWQMDVRVRRRYGQPLWRYLTEYKKLAWGSRVGVPEAYTLVVGPFMLCTRSK